MPEEIVLSLSADSAYAMQLAVTLASVAFSNPHSLCAAIILHDGFTKALKDRVAGGACEDLTIEWVDADSSRIDRRMMDGRLPASSYFRLQIPELLPTSVTKAIYLDADVLVRRPLVDLWHTPLNQSLALAARDARIVWAGAPGGLPWRELGIPPAAPYFNAGVMVIPLDRWRDERIGAQALDLLSRMKLAEGDQGGLNAVLHGRWDRLAPTWNLQGSHFVERNNMAWGVEPEDELHAAYQDPAVVHFSGITKPWSPRCEHPFRQSWFETLDRTAWQGWRPKRALAHRSLGRIRRAGMALVGR